MTDNETKLYAYSLISLSVKILGSKLQRPLTVKTFRNKPLARMATNLLLKEGFLYRRGSITFINNKFIDLLHLKSFLKKEVYDNNNNNKILIFINNCNYYNNFFNFINNSGKQKNLKNNIQYKNYY